MGIWAKSAGFNCSPDEVKKVLGSWDNASAMGMSGVTVNGLRYMYLSGNDKVVRGNISCGCQFPYLLPLFGFLHFLLLICAILCNLILNIELVDLLRKINRC